MLFLFFPLSKDSVPLLKSSVFPQEALMQEILQDRWRRKIVPVRLPRSNIALPFGLSNIEGFTLGNEPWTVEMVSTLSFSLSTNHSSVWISSYYHSVIKGSSSSFYSSSNSRTSIFVVGVVVIVLLGPEADLVVKSDSG